MPTRSTAARITRTTCSMRTGLFGSARSSRWSGTKSMHATPPLAARASSCASLRLRGWSQNPRRPVCESMSGPRAVSITSQKVRSLAWATSITMPSRSIARTSSRPNAVSPAPSPVAKQPRAASLSWLCVMVMPRTPRRKNHSRSSILPRSGEAPSRKSRRPWQPGAQASLRSRAVRTRPYGGTSAAFSAEARMASHVLTNLMASSKAASPAQEGGV